MHKIAIILFVIILLFCSSCANQAGSGIAETQDVITNTSIKEGKEPIDFHKRYEETIWQLLDMDLWTERDVQDSAHVLMMPMHYAYLYDWKDAVQKYEEFFSRFEDHVESDDFRSLSRMQRMQFLYLTTEYLKLEAEYERGNHYLLFELVLNCAFEDLYGVPTWKTEETVKEHLMQVLSHKQYTESRYSMVVDADFYTLAVLCDLKCVAEKTSITVTDEMSFASDYILKLLSDPAINTESDGYWLFQVGVAKDYKDYAYAGNEHVYEGIEAKQRDDIVSDSSHFRRMPLWLISFRDAQETQEEKDLFNNRLTQLGKLFSEKVLRQQNGYWVTTTFIDGTNGVFRYDYHNDGNSIEGYDQSGGTLFLGYWIMLNNENIKNAYRDIQSFFPLTPDESNPYHDEGITVREQNPIMDKDAAWENGLMETLVNCIVAIGERE